MTSYIQIQILQSWFCFFLKNLVGSLGVEQECQIDSR